LLRRGLRLRAVTSPGPDRWHREITSRTAKIADLFRSAGAQLPVPTCPGWTLRQLATHVGRAHRWAAEIVRTRSPRFIEFRAVPDGRFPDDPGNGPDWLTAGAQRLVSVLRAAGAEPVWAFGEQVPASFWARRMAHETMVHAVDAALAAGRAPALDPGLAADGIDEWLTVMSPLGGGGTDPRLAALPAGRAMLVEAADGGPDRPARWLIRHQQAGITVQHDSGPADVTLTGPAGHLLLVLLRRIEPASGQVRGDAGLLRHWLDGTPW
jgi:uncharacterized protein (TIGR03083 family)